MEIRSRITEMQMRRVVSKYELAELLGKGAYSQVFKAKHIEKGGTFAIKVINNKTLGQNAKIKECISNELAIHNVLQSSDHIVKFYQLLQTKNNCYFVYEYCQGGTLHEMIQTAGTLNQKKALSVFGQLVQGLKILRKHNIMHRDLKPENVLIKEGHFKLADFGFCKQLEVQSMTRTMLGSPLYMAPEVLRGQAYTVNADIWSIGVILYEMLYGHCPFQSNSIASLINTIDDTVLIFNPKIIVTDNIKRFISRCLQKNCKVRMTWEELFDQVNKLHQKQEINSQSSRLLNPLSQLKIAQRYNSNMVIDEHADHHTVQSLKTPLSKSKYEQFKENYQFFVEAKNESQVLFRTCESLKGQKKKSHIGRQSDFNFKDKEKTKQSKISYSKMVIQHQSCWNILKAVLEKMQSREQKLYPFLTFILKGVKKVLQRIYSHINLGDTQMLPVLSMVKYELIQIEKVQNQVQKIIIIQVNEQNSIVEMPSPFKQLWIIFEQSCRN